MVSSDERTASRALCLSLVVDMPAFSSLALWLVSAGLATLSASAAGPILSRVTPRARQRRAAEKHARTRIADVECGQLVKIVGRVQLESEALEAPFSGRTCAHYETAIELRRKGGFRRQVTEQRTSNFFVVDESGRALVDASCVLVDVVIDHLWPASELDAEERFEFERFLFKNGGRASALLGDAGALRYCEGAIEPDEVVTVVGVAQFHRASEPGLGYRDLGRRLVIEPPQAGRVFVSDGLHYA
jgi:hypothetical protein